MVVPVNTKEINESTDDELEEVDIEKPEEERSRLEFALKWPKWLRIILMFLPAFIYTTIILLVDYFIGFPTKYNPVAFIAIPGLAIFFLVVIGDMVYRNVFTYKMLRHETRKTRVYRQILKDKKKEQEEKARYELEDDEDEYYYEDDEEYDDEEIYDDDEEEIELVKEEYVYDPEDELTEDDYYRMKSYLLRGGLLTILLVNSVVLLGLAAIFQLALYGGFIVTAE